MFCDWHKSGEGAKVKSGSAEGSGSVAVVEGVGVACENVSGRFTRYCCEIL